MRRVALAMAAREIGIPELKERIEALVGWQAGSSVYQWFRRKLLPAGPVTAALPRALDVSAEWLYWGEGAMDRAAPPAPQQWVRGVQYAAARITEATAALQQEAARHDRELAAGFPTGLDADAVPLPGRVPIAPVRTRKRSG